MMPNDEAAEPATQVTLRGFAFANVTSMLVLVGATASLYGPLLVQFSTKFHLSLPKAGIVLSVNFVGAFFGVPLGWISMRRYPGKVVIGAALLLLAVGAGTVAFAAHWGLFLTGVFVIGLGFGALDFTLNTLLVRTAVLGRAHRLSLANAGYGVGAVVGPLLIIAVDPKNFPVIFGGVAAIAVVLSTLNGGVIAPPLTHETRRHARSIQHARRTPILVTFIVAYVLYVATESSTAGWVAAQLHREGYSTSIGSLVTGAFWLGLALGRSVGGPLYKRFSDKSLVLGGLALAIVLSLGAYAHVLAPYAYPIMGLVLASVYPMGLVWYTVLCPHDGDGLAMIILFMMLGGVIGPGAESLMVSLFGIHAVPIVIASFAALNVAAFASALRFKPTSAG